MSSKKRKMGLIIVAHPDDESIFFSGLILTKSYRWTVICVTDGNADGLGKERSRQFRKACRTLGVAETIHWEYPDIFDTRIDTVKLTHQISTLPQFDYVFTHGIIGEYGHPHHQDVSYAVHKALHRKCKNIYSVAYNIMPELVINLSQRQYEVKTKILWTIYSKEIRRFLNFLPATWTEGFARVNFSEVAAMYSWLTNRRPIKRTQLEHYRWLLPYLRMGGGHLNLRPF